MLGFDDILGQNLRKCGEFMDRAWQHIIVRQQVHTDQHIIYPAQKKEDIPRFSSLDLPPRWEFQFRRISRAQHLPGRSGIAANLHPIALLLSNKQ